jgi:predicted permease
LWAVRGAAIVTLLLFYVPSPPWEWLENPFPLFLIVPLSILFLAILWRLRKAPRKDGLALAMGAGGVLFIGAGLFVLPNLSGLSRFDWGTLLSLGLFFVAEAILTGGAVLTYRRIGYTRGDWKLLARGVVDPLAYFTVMALIISASGPLLYEQRLRHNAGEAAAWMKQLHACATAYAAGHPAQGFPARLDLLGPDGTKCLEPLPPSGEKAG